MAWYFFTMTGKHKWQRHLAEHRAQIMAQEQPEFATILDVNHPCDGEELPDNLYYKGDLYFDWDSNEDSLTDLLDDVKRFMNQLQDWGVDLNQASWYLSGKKGIHCTIPMRCCFEERICQAGVKDLYKIYGRFAWENSTQYMDMRVYSGRKGRMWRTTCRSRIVGDKITYKTPIAPEQLRQLDEDGYWAWCSVKREAITPNPPALNPHLATEMQVWANRLFEESKSKAKARPNPEIFAQWQSEKPPTLLAAFNGQAIDMSRDLNDISLQLATAAIAMGLNSEDKTEDFLALCEGFIQARSCMTGIRHKSRRDIAQRLRKSFHYCLHNSHYAYLPEVFASVLQDKYRTALDLRGIKPHADDEKLKSLEAQLQADMAADSIAIYQTGKKDTKPVADYSWEQGSLKLVRDTDGTITHYSVVAIVKGVKMPRKVVPLSTFHNIREFSEYLSGYGATVLINSAPQLAAARKALLNFVGAEQAEAAEVITTKTEGLMCIPTADPEDGEYQGAMFWIEPQNTLCSMVNHDPNVKVPSFLDSNNPNGQYGIDLSQAYAIKDHLSITQDIVYHLLNLNGDYYSLAVMLAWFTACTLKQPLYSMKRIKNFPLLQIVGQAGCGKTTTANIMLKLFTWRKEFRINIAGRNLTPFSLASLATASTSIPLVIDEVKPQNLGMNYMADFRGFLQTIYTIGSEAKRGGGDGTISSSYRTISKEPMQAPVCFLAEALEASQASIIERSVVAAFHKDATQGREAHARFLGRNERNIGILGFAIVQSVMDTNLPQLVKLHDEALSFADELLASSNNHRVVENAAMMFTGFAYFKSVIEQWYPNTFSDKLNALEHALKQPHRWHTKVASEIARMLGLLSTLSHNAETDTLRAIRAYHYDFETTESTDYILLHIEKSFYLYRERMKQLGMIPVFNSVEEFKFSISNSAYATDQYYSQTLKGFVVKLDPYMLAQDGIEAFKN